MNVAQNAHEILTIEWNQFQKCWQDSRAAWKDEIASQFEKRFMVPMESGIPPFLRALESLKDELKAAQRELR
jgi:hypothetical protein